MYNNGGCNNIIECIKEKTQTVITSDESFRIFKLLLSTGFVERLNYAYGPNPAVMLNDNGYQIMLQHGSYSAFIDSGKQEKKKVTEEKAMEHKNLLLDIQNKEWSLKTKWIVLIGGILGWIVSLLQFIFC